MAEPRKPRVIKTRRGATAPPPEAEPVVQEKTAVRSTSSKVSVEPVPTLAAAPVPSAKPAVKRPVKPARSAKPSRLATPQAKPVVKVAAPAAPKAPGHDGGDAQVLAFPMPAHKRRRRTFLYAAAGVLAVLALVMSFALFSPALAIKTVAFEGRKLVAEDTLQAVIAPIIGKPLPQVTEAQVQELLAPVVQVKSAMIEARPPSTLLVRIVERVPVALLKNEEEYLLVDPDGVVLGTATDPAAVPLPVIDGGKAVIGQDTFVAMTAVLANLPQSILTMLANATAQSPDAVELKLVDGRSIIWGDASDMELKAQVLEALLNAPAPTAPPGKPAPPPVTVFDVSAPRHPVTR